MRRTRLEIVEEPTAASHPHPGSAVTLLKAPQSLVFRLSCLVRCRVSTPGGTRARLKSQNLIKTISVASQNNKYCAGVILKGLDA